MKTVALATTSFAVFSAAPALLLAAMALLTRSSSRTDSADDFFLAAYLVVLATALSTLGFLLVTALSALWRGLTTLRAVAIAAALGFLAPVVMLFVAALGAAALLPLFRSAPRVATTLVHLAPGIVLGAAALLIARFLPTRVNRFSRG